MSEIQTDYLQQVYNVSDFARTVKESIKTTHRIMREIPFDSIAFTGTSGAALAYILSAELGIPLICVRKPSDCGHHVKSFGLFEGYKAAKRYIFVDDFISSGSTFRRVASFLKKEIPQATCVAAMMYTTTRADYEYRLRLDGDPWDSEPRTIKVFSNVDDAEQQNLQFYRTL